MSASALLDRLRLRQPAPPAPPPVPPPAVRDPAGARKFLALVGAWSAASEAARIADADLTTIRAELVNAKECLKVSLEADALGGERFSPVYGSAGRWGTDPAADAARLRALESEVGRLATRLPLVEMAADIARIDVAKATAALARDLHLAPAAALELEERHGEAAAAATAAATSEQAAIAMSMTAHAMLSMPVDPSAMLGMTDGTREGEFAAAKRASASAVAACRLADDRARVVAAEVATFERAVAAAQASRPVGR